MGTPTGHHTLCREFPWLVSFENSAPGDALARADTQILWDVAAAVDYPRVCSTRAGSSCNAYLPGLLDEMLLSWRSPAGLPPCPALPDEMAIPELSLYAGARQHDMSPQRAES